MERRILKQLTGILSIAVLLTACATAPPEPVSTDLPPSPEAELIPARELVKAPAPPPPRDLWERIRRQLTLHTTHNGRVGAAREHYLKQSRFFELISPRAEMYLFYLVQEVERRELPMELALLPLVESSLNPFAFSTQGAAGLWQIMPGTADDLGMRRDWWFDARLDIASSTNHALSHLEDLHAEFDDDWLLALAAYNSGRARVKRAVKRNRSAGLATDYWSLKLPRETQHYVPRLVALSTIIAFSEALEVSLPDIPNESPFAAVDTDGQIEMLRVAQLAGMTITDLRKYNPGQLRWATAPDGSGTVNVPSGTAAKLSEALKSLPASERVTWEHYRIRRGDSLIRIAKRFDTQVGLLREVNNIRGNFIRAGDTLMIPNSAAWEQSLALASAGRTGVKTGYKVRSGDSLYKIAIRFKVSIDDIIDWNDLDPNRYLQPGQSLTLFIRGS